MVGWAGSVLQSGYGLPPRHLTGLRVTRWVGVASIPATGAFAALGYLWLNFHGEPDFGSPLRSSRGKGYGGLYETGDAIRHRGD